ncbi:nicotinamidase/pyrazinamidase [Pseudoxanthobacter soli DSM 19599]|uniref:Nicotinamidase n=1 Tax=Pseudoxanthobacter soli DSM 19599 TaxID=1123029 RepID=A0A1M7ZI03_9HYPH|nr:bifunctional nicotinamidase/pyrazinamidase [Pseudoxanthobacter soli]SHO64518.1 nicotinamidase/pyrazinamidase [Pseudoxanthobacter soli DSM 19599]
MRFGMKDVLIGVDLQYGFMPGGNLPVADGDAVVPVVNRIARHFDNIVLTQDWHPPGHWSFASSHPGRKPFEVIRMAYGEQVLWPDHCVQGTRDAELHDDLDIPGAQLVLRKGYHKAVDSYSAFHAADRVTPTGLASYLRERGIERVVLAGLATDFCVAWTALDARTAGFETLVVEDACRAIDVQGSLSNAWAAMKDAGVRRITSADIG